MKNNKTRCDIAAKLRMMDIYGEVPNFTFKKQAVHRSLIGSLVTVLALSTFAVSLILRTQKLINGEDPQLSMVTLPLEFDRSIDLKELQYGFAVQRVDEKKAKIEASYVHWGTARSKETTPIQLVDCAEMGGQVGHLKVFENAENGRGKFDFLCPIIPEEFRSRGKFGDPLFDYIQIHVKGCDLGAECLSDEEVKKQGVNFLSLHALPNLHEQDAQERVTYVHDTSYFRMIDPQVRQLTNVFISQSTLILDDSVYDIFKEE